MKFAYNTNGWKRRNFQDVCEALHAAGYDAVEIAPQQDELPPRNWTPSEAQRLREIASETGIAICNLHAGARDLLGSRTPHEPSLISDLATDRQQRLEINKRAIDFAAELGTDLVCITSGMAPARGSENDSWERLADGIMACLEYAAPLNVRIAIEPEPELFVATCFHFTVLQQRLLSRSGRPENFGLNLDIGHAHVRYEDTPALIKALAPSIWHVHYEDIKNRVHKHLPPGQGDISFHEIGRALAEISYAGAVSVELMDHHRQAPEMARECIARLRTWRRSYRRAQVAA